MELTGLLQVYFVSCCVGTQTIVICHWPSSLSMWKLVINQSRNLELQNRRMNILDIIHHCNFYFRRNFGGCTLSPSSSKKPTLLNPINRISPNIYHNKNMMMDNIKKYSCCNVPLSQTFRSYEGHSISNETNYYCSKTVYSISTKLWLLFNIVPNNSYTLVPSFC
jgi:hypothetical protein